MSKREIFKLITKISSGFLITLSVTVAIPITINTFLEGGGQWGFGIIGFPILIPLSFYLLFGVAGMVGRDDYQRKGFIIANILTLFAGIISLFIIPVYPFGLTLVPIMLAVVGIGSRSKYRYFLILMIVLGVASNLLLLKWEVDFHRSLPIIELFKTRPAETP